MDKITDKVEYVSPSMKTVEFELEGSILIGSGGTAGGDAGGEDGWDQYHETNYNLIIAFVIDILLCGKGCSGSSNTGAYRAGRISERDNGDTSNLI